MASTATTSQLIRFHGVCQQDDRDIRPGARGPRSWSPCATSCCAPACRAASSPRPSGRVMIDKFAEEHSLYGSIRLTNRQTFQFHGRAPGATSLSMHQDPQQHRHRQHSHRGRRGTATCCTSNPVESELHQEAYEGPRRSPSTCRPRPAPTWRSGWTARSWGDEEPILGSTYLPRKFKTTVVILPHKRRGHPRQRSQLLWPRRWRQAGGLQRAGGGGLATPMATPAPTAQGERFRLHPASHVLEAAAAVVSTQRDWGNRVNRKNAKTKYTLERVGVEAFKAEVESRAGIQFGPVRPYGVHQPWRSLLAGWRIDGKHHLTLFIENGRLLDFPASPLKTGMLEIAKVHQVTSARPPTRTSSSRACLPVRRPASKPGAPVRPAG